MGEGDDFLHLFDIVLIRQLRRVNHNRTAARRDRVLDVGDVLVMIEVEAHRDVVFLHRRADERDEVILARVGDRRRRCRDDDRGAQLRRRLDNGRERLEVVDVECRNRVMVLLGIKQHVFRVVQLHDIYLL